MIGLDALEWEALDDFIAEGRLPNFQRLIQEGASGVLKTDFADSPITWTTIATGVNSEKHGLSQKSLLDPSINSSFMGILENVKYPRIWEVLPKYDLKPCVGRYYFVQKDLPDGQFVDFIDGSIHDKADPTIQKVLQDNGRFHQVLTINGHKHFPYLYLHDDLFSESLGIQGLEKFSGDLFMTICPSTDTVGHREWGFYKLLKNNDGLSGKMRQRAELGREIIAAVYEKADRTLGEILRRFPEALLLVCSDHGMHAERPSALLTLHPEFFALAGLPRDIGLNESRQIPGTQTTVTFSEKSIPVLTKDNIDFTISSPVIRFSGPDAGAAAAKVFARLDELRIDDVAIFEMAAETEIAAGKLFVENLPNMTAYGGKLFSLTFISGIHDPNDDGAVILHGPKVRKGSKISGATVADIAPTIYAYLEIPLAGDLDGKVLAEAFDNDLLGGPEKRKIKSYGTAPNYRPDSSGKELSEEEKSRLRSLGYLR